jgi:hypothetical protein
MFVSGNSVVPPPPSFAMPNRQSNDIPISMNMNPNGGQISDVRSTDILPGGDHSDAIGSNQHMQPMFVSGNSVVPPPPSFAMPSTQSNDIPIPPPATGLNEDNEMHTQMTFGSGKHSSSMGHTQGGMEEMAFDSGDFCFAFPFAQVDLGTVPGWPEAKLNFLAC